ncbi:hypothetical protein GCM10022393_19880 [Aquimarina addita]|uniref:DUF1772 domain-containing protein n=1 Tax=Aquimarina addita TaxID=870485 RepID=A0ABP6UI51_9FLAO
MINQVIEFITLLTTGLTAGTAIYVSLVTHPAWLSTSVASAQDNFTPVFKGSVASQALFSTTAIVGGIAFGILTDEYLWILGSVLMIINIPLTLIFLMPVNNKLMGKKGNISNTEANKLFKKWGILQWIRTVVVLIAFILFLWLGIFK